MLRYIVKRLLNLIPVVFVISLILFFILQLMPGDPVKAYIGIGTQHTPEQIEQIRHNLGLDQPIIIQYFKWLGQTLSGNLGDSVQLKKPVADIIGDRIMNSFILNIASFILAFAIAIPIGIKSAVKKYGAFDNAWSVFSLFGISMPSFFFSLLLIYAFAVNLQWFPVNMMVTAGVEHSSSFARFLDILKHMILPTVVLTIASLARITRYVRNSTLEVIKKDYIRTAYAKGLKDKVVIYKHAFRNALIPLITLIGLYIPALFSGSVILEQIFLWPGIGRALYGAIISRDYAMVMACNMFFAILLLLGNLLSDVGYAFADPRIRYD